MKYVGVSNSILVKASFNEKSIATHRTNVSQVIFNAIHLMQNSLAVWSENVVC